MNEVTHLISDLHLAQDRPDLFSLFEYYMKVIAPQSDQLFVLGDLFDAWIGDDCLELHEHNKSLNNNVVSLFNHYSNELNKRLYFIHGNRDFLLGEEFARRTGGELLDEPYFTKFSDTSVALMHGDTLCTDDIDYQSFRKIVREPQWQKKFLSQTQEKRNEIVTGLSQQSKLAQKTKTDAIMDVDKNSVLDFFKSHDIDCLIHGHTHRPKIHHLKIKERDVKRVVLSDWDARGGYLSISNNSMVENVFSLR